MRRIIYVAAVCTAVFSTGNLALAQAPMTPPPTTAPAPPLWTGSISLGLTMTRGNSDTTLFTAKGLASRKWDQNELELGADATYGAVDGVKNAEAEHGYGQFNHLFSPRFLGYLRLEALHDQIANVRYRITVGPGAGYYLIKETNTTLRVEAGPSYVSENLGGVHNDYLTLRLAERFEHRLNDKARVWQSLEFLPQVDDWSNYIANFEIGVETTLTKALNLQAYIQDSYHSEPATGRQKNDLKLVAAVAYKF